MRLEDKEALEAAKKLQQYCKEALEAVKKLQQYCNERLCSNCIFCNNYGCELDCEPQSYELDNIDDE